MFPSPIGELHFSILVQKTLFVLLHRFRPLSGSYISQFFDTGFIAIITPPFPSPIGELHFSITKRELINITDKQFPSPIGELHFSILIAAYYKKGTGVTGFRPLSGSYISQFDGETLQDKLDTHSFRPLSGSYISQSCDMSNAHVGRISFPSPIGELHFSMI